MLCPNAKKCSGCQLQNMEYEEQLSFKQAKLVKYLGRYGYVEEIMGMENPLNYRNKVQTAFGFYRGKVISGVYQSATGNIVQTDSCLLEDKRANKISASVKNLLSDFKIHAYDHRSGRGFLRHVLVRIAYETNEIMVVLVTSKGDFPSKTNFTKALLKLHPEITTIVWNINNTDKGLMLGDESKVLFGKGYITEKLFGLEFQISPKSFFQVNPVQTRVLYQKIMDFAALSGKEKVLDAYCGTGTIGLMLSQKAKEVIGVEVNRSAVLDAKKNAEINKIKNAKFFAADAGDFMDNLVNEGEKVDLVVTDPPRAGCSAKFLKSLVALSPKKIIYVSCNPETLARDLFTLRNAKYKVQKIQPVDMFPFTDHVETVVCLSK